jgi:cytochrome b
MVKVRIWDLPTRIFHGALALSVIGLVITGQTGGDAMVWHFRLGYTVFTLLLFRLCWGFVGGHWSRWWQLPLSWQSLKAYKRGEREPLLNAGHNPMGSWSVLVMLLWLALQVGTGLVSDDEIVNAGPLTSLVSGAVVSVATAWHKGWGKGLLLALVLLHVCAVAWYKIRKKQSLLPAMLHGNKLLDTPVTPSRDDLGTRLSAVVILLLCALAVRWVTSLGNA